jgi:uncharacterized protein YrrD
MLITTNHVIGLPIFTINEGKNIDKIEDVIYDPSSQRILALIVNNGGLFSEGKVIAMEDIKSIGDDAVVIQTEQALKNTSELETDARHIAQDDTYLTKSNVVTESGKNLGKITDLLFDPQTGKVEELEVSQGELRDMQTGKKRIRPEHIVTVGKDALIVSSFTEVEFDAQAEEGGLQGSLNQVKESAQEAVENLRHQWDSPDTQEKISHAKESVTAATESGRDKLQQVADEARQRLHDTKNDPENQRKLEDLKIKAEQTAEEVKNRAQQARDKTSQVAQEGQQQAKEKLEEQQTQHHLSKENAAVGQYITRNVLDQQDHLIAKRGDMVTHNMLDQAKHAGTLDNILANLSSQPIASYTGALGGEVERDANPPIAKGTPTDIAQDDEDLIQPT